MRNTPLIVIGVLLVVLGAAALLSGGFTYGKRETVVEVGPVTVTADRKQTVPLSPIFGGIGMACGAVMIVMGAKKN